MRSLARRVVRAEGRITRTQGSWPQERAITQWLRLLQGLRPRFERLAPGEERDEILDRLRRSITMLTAYESPPLDAVPHPYLEDYCHACLLRLSWRTNGWEGRNLAFAEADYDSHMAQIDRIERGRMGSRGAACDPGDRIEIVVAPQTKT